MPRAVKENVSRVQRIVVASIAEAQHFRPRAGERYAVLSLVDVGADPPRLIEREGFVERLIVHADDCTPRSVISYDGRTLSPLTRAQARQIAHFVQANESRADALLVHCHMGASRSPAAALAIAEALAITEIEMVQGKGVVPNPHVRDLLRAALGAVR